MVEFLVGQGGMIALGLLGLYLIIVGVGRAIERDLERAGWEREADARAAAQEWLQQARRAEWEHSMGYTVRANTEWGRAMLERAYGRHAIAIDGGGTYYIAAEGSGTPVDPYRPPKQRTWTCAYCHGAQADEHLHCANCGAPREGHR